MENNPNYWRAAITAAPEARFEGGNEQIEMLWRHMGDLSADADYSFPWALISEPFWIIFLLSGSFCLKLIWLYIIHDVILTTQLRYVLE